MFDFIKKLEENNAFSIIPKPNDINIIGSRWVFSDKYDASGNYVKAKARLTPLGYQQKKGIDYQQTFAPVVMSPSSRFLHVLGLKWGRVVKSFDVENAFQITKLNDEKVYMQIPQGFDEYYDGLDSKNQCIILHNAINGLKQSGNEFYKKLHIVMKDLGFKCLKTDSCVYVKGDHRKGEMILVGIHVDDAKFVAQNDRVEKEFVEKFNSRLKISDSGICEEFLKTRIVQQNDIITFDQTVKIEKYCKEFQVTKPLKHFEMDVKEIMKDERSFNDKTKYQSAIGGLIYIASSYRPDISTAVSQLATFNANPKESAWRAVIRLYGFLLYTKDKKLVYKKMKDTKCKFKIEIYVDANFNDPHLKNRSRSGYLIFVNDCLLSWYCKKQSILAQSTEEAEVYAANEATKSIMWLINFLNELNFEYDVPTMYEDCQNAILWIVDKKSTMRTRHFELRLQYVREIVGENLLKVKYINTDENPADMMTKVLGKNKYKKFSEKMGLFNSEEVLKNGIESIDRIDQ
jgi:hypothetical protein